MNFLISGKTFDWRRKLEDVSTANMMSVFRDPKIQSYDLKLNLKKIIWEFQGNDFDRTLHTDGLE